MLKLAILANETFVIYKLLAPSLEAMQLPVELSSKRLYLDFQPESTENKNNTRSKVNVEKQLFFLQNLCLSEFNPVEH